MWNVRNRSNGGGTLDSRHYGKKSWVSCTHDPKSPTGEEFRARLLDEQKNCARKGETLSGSGEKMTSRTSSQRGKGEIQQPRDEGNRECPGKGSSSAECGEKTSSS